MNTNPTTLQSYESAIQAYVAGTAHTVSGSVQTWIDGILALLPSQARIIEIGSGFGRDAQYIESRGFKVECTDGAEGFVNMLKGNGFSAQSFNILTDDFTSHYDLIFANAVFLHFTREELKKVLSKVYASLELNGLLAFSVKQGEGEGWTTEKINQPRYFCYWEEEPIRALLQAAGFENINISKNEKFLLINARKCQ